MNTTPIDAELAVGLRAGAAGSYAAEAAVELLIQHGTWLQRPDFVLECLDVDDAGDFVGVSWALVAQHVNAVDAQPSERAVALIAAQLGGYPEPEEPPVDIASMPPLAWLLASLSRGDVDLVLAAISHAAGTHDHVEHIGEPGAAGEWPITATSPRLRLGSLHPWPDPAGLV
jgi:hypothetical protein